MLCWECVCCLVENSTEEEECEWLHGLLMEVKDLGLTP